MPECSEGCGQFDTLKRLRNHWNDEHSGELWPDEEDLGPVESEQIDFDGEEPDDSEHDPEYVETNDPPETERSRLGDYDG